MQYSPLVKRIAGEGADAWLVHYAARLALERGEDVPGVFGKPVTHDDLVGILLGASWSKSDMRRSVQVHKLSEVGAFEELMEETHKRREQSEKAAVRAVWRRRVAD